MPDLLSHAFIAYTLCTLLALRNEWLSPQYVTIGMAGAFIPDMAKLDLVIDNVIVGNALGIPFNWFAMHTLGGAAIAVLIGVTLADAGERTRVGSLLALGAASHLLADALLIKASGRSYLVFWPITEYVPRTPGLYLSTDVWPSVVTGLLAFGTWILVRRGAFDRT
jgi:membrane-bound metal-dependent hydrolase YbcI (DUF457 family)